MSVFTSWRRSSQDRVLAGVCGGLAEAYAINSNLLRIVWVLSSLWISLRWGVLVYIAAAIFIPDEDKGTVVVVNSHDRTPRWLGIILVVFGAYLLLGQLVPGVVGTVLAEIRRIGPPLFLIALGMWVMLRQTDKKKGD